MICYNFDKCECILIFFRRDVTDKVSNQKTLYYATAITRASALPGKTRKHENCIFFTQMLHQCITRIQPVAP